MENALRCPPFVALIHFIELISSINIFFIISIIIINRGFII